MSRLRIVKRFGLWGCKSASLVNRGYARPYFNSLGATISGATGIRHFLEQLVPCRHWRDTWQLACIHCKLILREPGLLSLLCEARCWCYAYFVLRGQNHFIIVFSQSFKVTDIVGKSGPKYFFITVIHESGLTVLFFSAGMDFDVCGSEPLKSVAP
jgi:hypothetical protein